jgi:hypothetical protein
MGGEDPAAQAGSPPRAPGALRRAAWAFQEKVLWKAGDAIRGIGASVRWPLESAAWGLRSHVAWPIEDGFVRRGPAGKLAVAGAGLVLLAGVGTAGALVAHDGSGNDPASPPRVALPTPPPVAAVVPAKQPKQPADTNVLNGAPPSFGPEADGAPTGDSAAEDAVPAQGAGSGSSGADGTDSSSPAKGAKVRPALKVAHRFAGAFVSYEVGKDSPRVRKVFRKTATEPLAESLARRPPRQPASVKVPRARVLNVVPGPRRGPSVSVSVSLLRVGATSELRLELQQVQDKWLVSDVRG